MINYSSQRILLEAIRALKARQQQGGQAAGAGRIAQRPAQPTVVSWPGSERQTLPNYPPPQQPAGGGEIYGQNVPKRQPMTQPPEQFDSAFGADQRNFAPQTQAQPRQGKTLLQRGGGLLAELLRGIALGKGGYQQYQMMKQTEDIRKQQARDEMNRWIQQLGMQEGKERRMFDYKEAMEKPKKAKDLSLSGMTSSDLLSQYRQLTTTKNPYTGLPIEIKDLTPEKKALLDKVRKELAAREILPNLGEDIGEKDGISSGQIKDASAAEKGYTKQELMKKYGFTPDEADRYLIGE